MAGSIDILNMSDIAFLKNPPSFVGTQATAQSIVNSTWVSISLDSSQYDNYGGHSNSVNNSRYTCQVGGWYTVVGGYAMAANSAGFRAVRLLINGVTIVKGAGVYTPNNSSAEGVATTVPRDIQLNVGDYIEVQGWQNSGGNLNTSVTTTELACSMWVRFSHF